MGTWPHDGHKKKKHPPRTFDGPVATAGGLDRAPDTEVEALPQARLRIGREVGGRWGERVVAEFDTGTRLP